MSEAVAPVQLIRVGEYVWEIPRQGGMRVPARIYASEKVIGDVRDDPALAQVANVAHLPGIVGHALAMPDIHWGYGFPIGGVAGVEAHEGRENARGPRLHLELRAGLLPHRREGPGAHPPLSPPP